MRSITRFGTALLLGAAMTACGGNKDNGSTTAQAGGEPAAATATDSAAAGAPAGGAAADLAGMSAADQLAVLGSSNAAEIATSKAAVDKLTNAEAKSYARDMIREHTAAQGQADQKAKAANLKAGSPDVATQKTKMANDMAQQIQSGTKGAALDKQYIDGQVQAHQETLTQLQALENSSDSTVKALATATLPKVQAHLERAQKIQQSLGGGSATDSANAAPAAGGSATAKP